ncbi:MAG: HAD hydrolase family protein [bacterium]|nr:HAD hydrolase family protein [bacterium]
MDIAPLDLLMLDVDGVLTAGQVTFGEQGPIERSFDVHDGCCLKLWQRCGGRVAIISGRQSPAVQARARELGIATVVQGAGDKVASYETVLEEHRAADGQVCFVGDDLPDLGPMRRCGFPVAVENAVPAVKRVAEYVTRSSGGRGAVAEVVELILRKQGHWSGKLLAEA